MLIVWTNGRLNQVSRGDVYTCCLCCLFACSCFCFWSLEYTSGIRENSPTPGNPFWDAPAGRDFSSFCAKIPLLFDPLLGIYLLLCICASFAQLKSFINFLRQGIVSYSILSFPQMHSKCFVHWRHLIDVYWNNS